MWPEPSALALLNIGASELVLIFVLYILFFGADKLPAFARSVGRFQARITQARRQIEREMRTSQERAMDELREFERMREAQIRSTSPAFLEEQRVRAAARALGIPDADTASVSELRSKVAAAVAGGAGSPTGP